MPESLNSSEESVGFHGWPEYSEPGDWLDHNAGVPPTALFSPSQGNLQLQAAAVQDITPVPSSPSSLIPPAKKVKYSSASCKSFITIETKGMRLPTPCPLPTVFTEDVAHAIANNNIKGIIKIRLERQAAAFYYGLCPWPKPTEYNTMAKAMCDKFPSLRSSKHEEYWVSMHLYTQL